MSIGRDGLCEWLEGELVFAYNLNTRAYSIGEEPLRMVGGYADRLLGDAEDKSKCAYCGQWGESRSACTHCGAPIDD